MAKEETSQVFSVAQVLQEHSIGEDSFPRDESEIVASLERSITLFLPSEEKEVANARINLVRDFFESSFAKKYQAISRDIVDLTRKVKLEYSGQKGEIEIPLFSFANFDGEPWTYKPDLIMGKDRYRNDLTLESKIPPITKEVREKAKEAMAFFAETYARALRTPVLGDVLTRYRKEILSVLKEDPLELLKVFWIPDTSKLEVKVRKIDTDPVLMAALYKNLYVVTTWNVEGEIPYQHYLIEFAKD